MPKIYSLQQGTGLDTLVCYIDYEIGDNSITINDIGGYASDKIVHSYYYTTVYVNINENIHQFLPKAEGIEELARFSDPEVSWENEPIVQNNISDIANITITFSTYGSIFLFSVSVGSDFIYISQNGGDFVKRKMYVSLNGGNFEEVTKDKFKIIGE